MGHYEGGLYWHAQYFLPTQYSTSFGYQAGCSQEYNSYDYGRPAPSGLDHHASVHAAVESLLWRTGSSPSPTSSSHDLHASSSAGSGHYSTTGTPFAGSLAPFKHSCNQSLWGSGPIGRVGNLLEPVLHFAPPLSRSHELPSYLVGDAS